MEILGEFFYKLSIGILKTFRLRIEDAQHLLTRLVSNINFKRERERFEIFLRFKKIRRKLIFYYMTISVDKILIQILIMERYRSVHYREVSRCLDITYSHTRCGFSIKRYARSFQPPSK